MNEEFDEFMKWRSESIDDAIQLVRKEEGKTIVSTPPVSDRDSKKSKKRD